MPLSESAESPILARSGRGRLIQVNLPPGGVGGAQCMLAPQRCGLGCTGPLQEDEYLRVRVKLLLSGKPYLINIKRTPIQVSNQTLDVEYTAHRHVHGQSTVQST